MDEVSVNDIVYNERVLFDVIRCNPDINKTDLAAKLNLSFPTISKKLESLAGMITTDPKTKVLKIVSDSFWLCGISIGGAQTKITFVDAKYHPVDKERFNNLCEKYSLFCALDGSIDDNNEHSNIGFRCFPTPSELPDLLIKLDSMVSDIIRLKNEADDIPTILSIGIAITGSIDAKNQIIVQSGNVSYLRDLDLNSLLPDPTKDALKKNNISIMIDHNAKALAVCEKFSLYDPENKNHKYSSAKNIASLYLGSGLGCGIILGNRLMRGTSNFNGEIGKLTVPRHRDMIDWNPTNNGIAEETSYPEYCGLLEELIRTDIFGDFPIDFKKASSHQIISVLESMKKDEDGLRKKEKKLKALGYYLNLVVEQLTQLLNVELIIFSGKITCLYDQLFYYLKPDSTKLSRSVCVNISSAYAAFAPTIGAAILSNYEPNAEIIWYD